MPRDHGMLRVTRLPSARFIEEPTGFGPVRADPSYRGRQVDQSVRLVVIEKPVDRPAHSEVVVLTSHTCDCSSGLLKLSHDVTAKEARATRDHDS